MNETTEATAIFAPIWKRKWLILGAALLVALVTYAYYDSESRVYSATTQLYIPGAEGEQAPAPKKHKKKASSSAASGAAAGAAAGVNSPVSHQAVAQTLRAQFGTRGQEAAAGKVKAKGGENSAFVVITAEAGSRDAASLLADETAQVFIGQQFAASQAATQAAIASLRTQLKAVELEAIEHPGAALAPATKVKGKGKGKGRKSSLGIGKTSAALEEVTLSSKINQEEAALNAPPPVQQFGAAKPSSAKLIRPTPRQNAIFGFAIALLLASVAVYFLSRFDRRVRSVAGIERLFGAPILAALPSVRHPIVRRFGVLAPSRELNETLRRLNTALQLTAMSHHSSNGSSAAEEDGEDEPRRRSILFLSPDSGDGKSTIVAALALVQRESGERVAVVEADFRRPVQSRLLDLNLSGGLAEVLAGSLSMDEAMQTVGSGDYPLSAGEPELSPVSTVVESRAAGELSVLLGSPGVPNPPALLASRATRNVLRSLTEDFDYTLIDAPPPLLVSDVMPLLPVVDGIVLVARVGHTREIAARRLAQVLTETPSAPVLGAVANDVSRADLGRYGYYGYYSSIPGQRWLDKLLRR